MSQDLDDTFDFEVINGRVIPIVTRKSSNDPVWCPYCDCDHTHNPGDGHRATHCSTVVAKRTLHINGQKIDESHGYIIRTLSV